MRQLIWVPGSFEIGVLAQSFATSGKYDAVLCIGAVVSRNSLAPQ